MIKSQNYQLAKDLVETGIKTHKLETPSLFMLCGQANLALGYLIIAEQMFQRCLEHEGY